MTDGIVLRYQKGRQVAMDGNLEQADEVARSLGLSTGQTALLVATSTHWHLNRDKDAFVEALRAIYKDERNEPAVRALAAEHVSSCFDGDEAVHWSLVAVELPVGEVDGQIIRDKVDFGLWDRGLRDYTTESVHGALNRFFTFGAFDAPGRVKWWIEKGLDLESDEGRLEALHWLERAAAIDTGQTSANIYYTNWCRKKLDEL